MITTYVLVKTTDKFDEAGWPWTYRTDFATFGSLEDAKVFVDRNKVQLQMTGGLFSIEKREVIEYCDLV